VTFKVANTFCSALDVPATSNFIFPVILSYLIFILLTTIVSVLRQVEKPSVSSTSPACAGRAARVNKKIVVNIDGDVDVEEDGDLPGMSRRSNIVIV